MTKWECDIKGIQTKSISKYIASVQRTNFDADDKFQTFCVQYSVEY